MVILVVGLMRTGTSLVSRQLHRLGVPMGTEMRFPFVGENGQEDWEDKIFTDKCLAALKGNIRKARLRVFFNSYIRQRSVAYKIWGVKSPFLLPYVDLFKSEAASLGHTVKVVLCKRFIVHTIESLKKQLGDSAHLGIEVQKILCTYEDPRADLIIPIEESWNTPELVRQKLIDLIRSGLECT